jgi:hypothetical protein
MGMPAAQHRPRSTYRAYRLIWRRIFENLGFMPVYVDSDDLLSGRLAGRLRVLVLSKTVSLSEEEVTALERFASAGGLIFADSYTGILDESGKMYDRSPFDIMAGIRMRRPPTAPAEAAAGYTQPEGLVAGRTRYQRASGALRDMFEGADANAWDVVDASIEARGSRAYLGVSGVDAVFYRKVDAGGVVYLNLSLLKYPEYAESPAHTANISRLVGAFLEESGVRPTVRITKDGRPLAQCRYYLFQDPTVRNMLYLSIIPNDRMKRPSADYRREPYPLKTRGAMVRLPGTYHVYDMDNQTYIGSVDSFELDEIDPQRAATFALLPYRIRAFNLEAGVSADRILSYFVELVPESLAAYGGEHVVRLEVFDPKGTLRQEYCLNLQLVRGRSSGGLQLAVSDPAGTWQVKAADIASGEKATATFTLASEFEPLMR